MLFNTYLNYNLMKLKINFSFIMSSKLKLIKTLVKRSFALFALIFLIHPAFSQLPTAQQVASQMKVGWNLGNTLEAICSETAWGNPAATQTLINSVKAAGFNTVRIPVSWDCHSSNNVIDAAWIARVKTVVDYCITANMYVIINIHWDNGWLENNVTTSAQASVNVKQQAYWSQIANYFKAYDQRVLFASANEPNVSDATGMSVLLSYHQTFINAVRATGGNNSSRTLIIQGPSTDIEKTNNLMNTMPTDQIASRLMVEVHYYTPWNFCGMTADESWGSMFYYWGNGYHSTTETSRNATWGEESDVERYFGYMKTKFVDKGIPVIIGEFGAIKRSNPSDLSLHLSSRQYYNKYIVSSAMAKGMVPIYWDNGASDFGLFNRSTGAITDQGVVTAIMQGAGGTTIPVTGVSVSPTSASVAVNATTQITATVSPSNATNKTVTWSSSNTGVATVSSTGLVRGVAAGSATITVRTADGGRTATCAVTVTSSGCTPTTITPYVQVNGGSWQQTSSVTVSSGATVKFGPQPVSGGSWSWTGCGTSGTSREQTIYPTSSCTATATYTNASGCKSTQNFNVTVGSSSTYIIVVRARGTSGSESIGLTVGGTQVASWTLTTSLANYSVSTSLGGVINVQFTNDAGGRDVQVDYITVAGATRQAESQATNTGVWQNSRCGGSYSEWLHCNGYISFAAYKSTGEQGDEINRYSEISIYPNPSEGYFEVTGIDEGILQIYNLEGRCLFTKQIDSWKTNVDPQLEAGMYVIKIITPDGKAETRKLIME